MGEKSWGRGLPVAGVWEFRWILVRLTPKEMQPAVGRGWWRPSFGPL